MASVIQRSFSGGELAPALHARADLAKYTTGLRTCRNFLVRREGGVSNRAGFRFVDACKFTTDKVFLLRYVSPESGNSLLIEAGDSYLRFYLNGAAIEVSGVVAWSGATAYVPGDLVSRLGVNYYAVLAGTNHQPPNATYWYPLPGVIYEIPHPFGAHQFNWVQSANVITLTHADVHPQELIFSGLTSWVIQPVTTTPDIAAPTAVVATASLLNPGPGPLVYRYLVTAAAPETYEESAASDASLGIEMINPPAAATPTVLTWTAPPGVTPPEYYIYSDPYGNGTYGFIGTATGVTTFNDVGFIPDFAVTPPIPRALFDTVNNYPHVASYFQQRRIFAHTNTTPDGIWASRIGFPSNFGITSPLQDDDAVTFRIAGAQQHAIRSLLSLKTLLVLTSAGEWVVGASDTPLTPSNIPVDQQVYVGSHDKAPVVVGNAVVYIQARGSIVRDLQFSQQIQGFGGSDLTIFASHLFDGYTLARLDYQQTPHSTVWAVRGDGTLLGLTYIPDQQILAWHRHDTGAGGVFEDVCVVPEVGEDIVYVIVRRTIGGTTVRYIERLEPRTILDFNTDAFFVDSGLSYSGAPADVFSGLEHLEGEVLAVLGDGQVVYNGDPTGANAATYRVTGGAVTLPAAYSTVHLGLPMRADLETLDLDIQGSAIRDKKKRVHSVVLLVDKSARTFWVGPDADHLTQQRVATFDPTGREFTGQCELSIDAHYNPYGRIFVRHTDPLPLTILGAIPNVEVGG